MYRVAVTGGSGFLGSYVVDELLLRGYEVIIFDLQPSKWHPKVDFYKVDISDPSQIKGKLKNIDYVFHFAGLADLNQSLSKPRLAVELNVNGTYNILEECLNANVKRFLYASSAYVFSTSGAMYGASKRASELIIEEFNRSFGLDYSIIRYGSVYGERADESNRMYRILVQALTEKKIDFLGDGSEVREYIHASDAAKLSVDLLDDEFSGHHVILTGVEKYSYRELLSLISEMFKNGIKIDFASEDYKGHYTFTPYSFSPTVGKKLVANPFIDFGQGILSCIESIHHELEDKNSDKN